MAPGLTAAPPPRAAREHARPACQRRAAPAEGKPRERSPEPAAGGLAAARRLLRLQTVNLLIKMLGLGLLVAAVITYDRRLLRRAGRLDAGSSGARGAEGDVEIVTEAVIVGISEVDPEPLANVAGEGIDPDAVSEAHRSVQEQRERLPVSGKNIP